MAQTAEKDAHILRKRLYLIWGYNRDRYTSSTVHFIDKGTGDYDFRLYNATAKDQPNQEKILRTPLSVPQYNFALGYLFNPKKNMGIELSWHHLKYVIRDNQMLHLKGTIQGQYFDQDTLVGANFVHLEHTNGNNYLRLGLVKTYNIVFAPKQKVNLQFVAKYQAGVLWPKTYSKIMGAENDGPFRPSGLVVGLSGGLRLMALKYLFLEPSFDFSYAVYTGAKLSGTGRARQKFGSMQSILAAGISVPF